MEIKKSIKDVEEGLNEIISIIKYHKQYEVNNINMDSIGSVKGHLKALETIDVLEDVLNVFGIMIDSMDYDDVVVKVED